MKPVRWGIIGCGDVTEVKSGPAFQKARDSALTAVMRRNGERARDYALRHGVPSWYDSAEALVQAPDVDAVYVATPPSSHLQYVLLAAAAGKPVYVEKPMALNARECRQMIDACSSARVPLFVAYYRRALPRFLKVKEVVQAGGLGQVRFVDMQLVQPTLPAGTTHLPWRLVPEIAGGGLFVDLACHMLDLLDFLFGPVRGTWGVAVNQGGRYAAEDLVSATLAFESGIVAAGTWCFAGHGHSDVTEIVGSAGRLSFSTFGWEPLRLSSASGTVEIPAETPQHVQQPLIQTIVDELNGTGRCPSRPESAMRTTEVMDKLLAAYYGRQ